MKTSEVFRRARRILWDGKDRIDLRNGKEEYICYAIKAACWRDSAAVSKTTKVIEKRIKPYVSLEGWLLKQGVLEAQVLTCWKMQAHRKAWLTMLIQEFEAKGD